MIRYGFNTALKPIEEYFPYVRENSINHMEVDLISEHSYIETFDQARIDRINDFCGETGATISLHSPYTFNPSEKLPMLRDAAMSYLRRCIEVASKIHATHITCHIGYCIGLPSWEWMRQEGLERLVVNFGSVMPLCEKLGVTIAVENVNPMAPGFQFFYLGDNIEDFRFLFDNISSGSFRFTLDVGHANTNEGPIPYIENFSERLVNVHFHDNHGEKDEHLNAGEGSINWKELMQAFSSIGYSGPFVSECFNEQPVESRARLLKYI